MIAYEEMHYMKRKTSGKTGWMAINLDMSKAYDPVEWSYLSVVLCKMGFDTNAVSLIMKCVTSARYEITHAGREFGNIILKRGLRQGDPLSSYLFLVCIEGFTSLIKKYESRRLLRGIQVARKAPRISHMFFADDCFIYCKVDKEEVNHIIYMLRGHRDRK